MWLLPLYREQPKIRAYVTGAPRPGSAISCGFDASPAPPSPAVKHSQELLRRSNSPKQQTMSRKGSNASVSEDQVDEFKDIFEMFDVSRTGSLSKEDLKQVCSQFGKRYFRLITRHPSGHRGPGQDVQGGRWLPLTSVRRPGKRTDCLP